MTFQELKPFKNGQGEESWLVMIILPFCIKLYSLKYECVGAFHWLSVAELFPFFLPPHESCLETPLQLFQLEECSWSNIWWLEIRVLLNSQLYTGQPLTIKNSQLQMSEAKCWEFLLDGKAHHYAFSMSRSVLVVHKTLLYCHNQQYSRSALNENDRPHSGWNKGSSMRPVSISSRVPLIIAHRWLVTSTLISIKLFLARILKPLQLNHQEPRITSNSYLLKES